MKGSHFVSLHILCFTESPVIFLCARFCLNHVQMVLKKKKEIVHPCRGQNFAA